MEKPVIEAMRRLAPVLLNIVLLFPRPTVDCDGQPLQAAIDSYHAHTQTWQCAPFMEKASCTSIGITEGDFPADPTADFVQLEIGGVTDPPDSYHWYLWQVTGTAGGQTVCPDVTQQ